MPKEMKVGSLVRLLSAGVPVGVGLYQRYGDLGLGIVIGHGFAPRASGVAWVRVHWTHGQISWVAPEELREAVR